MLRPRPTGDPATAAAARSEMSRRNLLRLALAGAGAAAAGPLVAKARLFRAEAGAVQQNTVAGVISGTAPMAGPSVAKFERELPVPSVLAPLKKTINGQTVRYYDITQKVGALDILPAPFPRTEIWGYNGVYPGPTLKQVENEPGPVRRQDHQYAAEPDEHAPARLADPAGARRAPGRPDLARR